MASEDTRDNGGAGRPAGLEAPAPSTTGLSGEERRAIFLDERAVRERVDVAKNIEWFGCDLSLIEYPEWQRTKHVHRLHPYLGKFIPQLVEIFLRRFFEAGQSVLDPFAGSGTTLVEANVLGIDAVGVELSPFNCLIMRAKTQARDLDCLRREVADALSRLEVFSLRFEGEALLPPDCPELATESEYLRRWFAPRALEELLFFRSIIPDYENQDVLKVILSRAARSARLIPHYDLARPKKPLAPDQEYYCAKHRRMCRPITEALKFLRRYSRDTVRRLAEFSRLRTDASLEIIEGDARTALLPDDFRFDGIFTSPPYVGMIDYHEQHRYAYELFPELQRRDEEEIGAMSLGKGKKARDAYQRDIATVFRRLSRWAKPGAKVFVVANDRFDLYPAIAEAAGLRLVDVFHRPVPMRTERDTATYFESIFWLEAPG